MISLTSYQGIGGLLQNTPFINCEIRGWLGSVSLFLGLMIAHIADLAVVIASYLRPFS